MDDEKAGRWALDCAALRRARSCSAYKYRFVEGLAATRVRCPTKGCGRGRGYYFPVNAFDVARRPRTQKRARRPLTAR